VQDAAVDNRRGERFHNYRITDDDTVATLMTAALADTA